MPLDCPWIWEIKDHVETPDLSGAGLHSVSACVQHNHPVNPQEE